MKFRICRIHLALCLLVATSTLALPPAARAQAPNSPVGNHLVGTVLGTPETQAVGDARASADFFLVADFLFLPSGDIIIADRFENRLLRAGVDGIVRPWAGNGSLGSGGDGGAAADAGLASPVRLAADDTGNVYVAHASAATAGFLIRRISPLGIITKVVGGGSSGCPEIGSSAATAVLSELRGLAVTSEGIYFTVFGCPFVYRVGGDGLIANFAGAAPSDPNRLVFTEDTVAIPANRLSFGAIVDIAADRAGNLLVADSTARLIARITPAGVALRVAGPFPFPNGPREGPAMGIHLPALRSIAALADGSVLVGQAAAEVTGGREELGIVEANGSYRILFTTDGASNRPVATLGSDPIAPMLVRAATDGSYYFRDRRTGAVLRALSNGTVLPFLGAYPEPEQVTPNGTQPVFRVARSTKLVADTAGNLYLGARQRLYRLSADGALTHIAGNGSATLSPDGTPPLETGLGIADELDFDPFAIDGSGSLYWLTSARSVRKLSTAGVISTVLGGGSDPGPYDGKQAATLSVNSITQWAVSASGEIVFLTTGTTIGNRPSTVLWRVASTGTVSRVGGTASGVITPSLDGVPALEANLSGIERTSVSPGGTVFFTRFDGIFRIDNQGVIRQVSTGSATPLVDGGPTLSAPSLVGGILRPLADDQILVSAGVPMGLARYTLGGAVNVWRDGLSGKLRNDGALLKDDQFSDSTSLVVLPDGSLAWLEVHRNRTVVRRSFPVPNGCTYTTSANEIPVSGGNVLTQVTLTTGADCPWTVGSSANWLEILSPRFGKGTVTLNLRALANPSPSERTATLRVAGKEVLVRQGPTTSPNIFVVSPVSANVPPTGGSVEVTISASPGVQWQVALPGVPINIQGPSAGSGSNAFVLTLQALPANVTERTVVVSINDKTVTLRQVAPPVAVPITINSVPAGSKATIDLIERTLPYVAQWVPGSYHFLQAAAFTKVNDNTLIQFQTFGTADNSPQQVYITPPGAATLTAQYRTLYLLRARPLVQTLPSTVMPIVEFDGVSVPPSFVAQVTEDGAFAKWYPAGQTVRLFAPEEVGLRFVNFTGGLTTTENPVTVQMDAPATITANYATNIAQQTSVEIGGRPRWLFYGSDRRANPAQVAVALPTGGEPGELKSFVAYASPVDLPAWLTLRASNPAAPLTLEAGVDAAKAAQLPPPPFPSGYSAYVYLHRPGMRTAMFEARASLTDAAAGTQPRITMITDAGGFRQSVGDSIDNNLIVSPGMILTMFGVNLASANADASALPLPTVLGGISVEAAEAGSNTWTPQPLFFVSPNQVNFQLSPSLFPGDDGKEVRVRVRTGPATVSDSIWTLRLRNRSVSLFSADSSGGGAPAGFFVRVRPNQTQQRGNLFQCAHGVCTVPATAFGAADNDLFLELFGTGFREPGLPGNLRAFIGGRPADVAFAGPHPVFVGLDQLNIKVPRDIAKGQSLDLYVWVRNGSNPWIASNRLTVRFE